MARNAARLKMGYYPLPEGEAARLRAMLKFAGPASVVDPCVGQGTALEIITHGTDVHRFGVELDAERAVIAQSKGIETIQGNAFDAVAKPESFSLLYLNPPYDSEIGLVANNRMERLFLDHTYRWLVMDGVLAMVIPFERLKDCIGLLGSHFSALSVFRMTDEESVRFRQIVVLGLRSNVRGAAVDANKRLLQRIGLYGSYQELPELVPGACESYRVPPSGEAALSYRGLPYDLLEDLLQHSGAWKQVIAHVMTAQMVEGFETSRLPKLREAVASMERSTRELHERVMAVRMLPVGTLFQRYSRTVFDIAQSTGKKIRLETDGEETEIDKSMLELLGDPLTHLIRNAADHGIESPEKRAAAGKSEEGLITLRAFHRAGRIVIEVGDDGAGIDTKRVREKAIERGLIAADPQLTEEQFRLLIFEPGFSTSEKVSDLSGRGVGMDVVKRNVQQLNGTIAVTSETGHGTTVSIELPLTLAILEGLLVRVGDRTLVLPLLSVIETVPLRDDQIVRVASHGEVVVIREESIPLLRLSRFLGFPSCTENFVSREVSDRRLAVIVQAGAKKVGLVVDELLGQQQVVVKSLERHLRKIDGLMGATILGDGCVAPIVDVAGIATLNLFSLQTSTKAAPQARPALAAAINANERGGSAHALV